MITIAKNNQETKMKAFIVILILGMLSVANAQYRIALYVSKANETISIVNYNANGNFAIDTTIKVSVRKVNEGDFYVRRMWWDPYGLDRNGSSLSGIYISNPYTKVPGTKIHIEPNTQTGIYSESVQYLIKRIRDAAARRQITIPVIIRSNKPLVESRIPIGLISGLCPVLEFVEENRFR